MPGLGSGTCFLESTMTPAKSAQETRVRAPLFPFAPSKTVRLMIATVFWVVLLGWLIFYSAIVYYGNTPSAFPRTGVVFTGGPARVTHGLHLLHTGALDAMLISGIHAQAFPALDKQRQSLQLSLGTQARDTRGNVEEAKQWLRKKRVSTFTLITSDFHMPRALLLLKKHTPELTPVPWGVRTSPYKRFVQAWREYPKFLWSFIWVCPPNLGHRA